MGQNNPQKKSIGGLTFAGPKRKVNPKDQSDSDSSSCESSREKPSKRRDRLKKEANERKNRNMEAMKNRNKER